MTMAVGSAYIHIPFCAHKCDFCDFAAFAGVDDLAEEYCRVVACEIEKRIIKQEQVVPLKTVFYGGGTPGYIDPDLLAIVHNTLRDTIGIAADAEVTLETTPQAVTVEKTRRWIDLGINRLSIGVESLSDSELKAMGRDHTEAQAYGGIEAARRGGCVNLALDLMYGLPEQTEESWRRTLDKTMACRPDHLSAYGLTISGQSPLLFRYPLDSAAYPCEDVFVSMYDMLIDTCAANNLAQYEISNFAAEGKQSRHNITYWQNHEYYGFGVSACRYVNGARSSNFRSLAKYMRECTVNETEETIEEEGKVKEAIFLGLRMCRGLDLQEFKDRYAIDLARRLSGKIPTFVENGFMEFDGTSLRLTRKGLLVSNTIMAELI